MRARSAVLGALLLSAGASVARGQAAPVPAAPAIEQAETLVSSTIKIYGTLELPKEGARWPVVLIIAGSGPTDRNGNSRLLSGHNNGLKYLADGLAAQGIASLRYDKRAIGQSVVPNLREVDLRFDNYVDDAAGWIRQLRADPRFSTITVMGHSEGSLVGMLAARAAAADGFVSLAGAGRPIAVVLHEQLVAQLPPDLLVRADSIMGELSAGRTVDSVPAKLWVLFRQSVQPYLISWFRYDPAKDLAALPIPVLVVQGTTDIQVDTTDAKRLAANDPRARLLLIDGMNHVLKMVPADRAAQAASYGDPALPIAPKLLEAAVAYIRGLSPTP
ncbi:MAG: alpha/beta hydrolase [Gemmatimonadales bacterium]